MGVSAYNLIARSNCHFSVPEPIRLATGDSIGRIGTDRTPLYMTSADLQNAFYTMSMPTNLKSFFLGLRGLSAKDLGVEELDGVKLNGKQFLYPRIAVIPMGWSWAMWWCQHVNQLQCDRAGLRPDRRLSCFPRRYHRGIFGTYNMLTTCTSLELVKKKWRGICGHSARKKGE